MSKITCAMVFPFLWWISLLILSIPFTAGMSVVLIFHFNFENWICFFQIFSISYPFLFLMELHIKNITEPEDKRIKQNITDELFKEIDQLQLIQR